MSEEIEALNRQDRDLTDKINSIRRLEETDNAALSQKRPELARYQERSPHVPAAFDPGKTG